MKTANKNFFVEKILIWTKDNMRIYPWREERTPYKVFISEFLLTRTKADQVVPSYMKIISEYPDIRDLILISDDALKEYRPLLRLSSLPTSLALTS